MGLQSTLDVGMLGQAPTKIVLDRAVEGKIAAWRNGLAHARESWRELELCLDLECNMRKKSPINRPVTAP